MGRKKGKASAKNPEDKKELGNKAFLAKRYDEAIKHYSEAIKLSEDDPNHIYFANRANAKLEIKDFQGCIEDCDDAIQIDATYVKTYLRKAKALRALDKFNEALEMVLV